jgi:hypothetical protein
MKLIPEIVELKNKINLIKIKKYIPPGISPNP